MSISLKYSIKSIITVILIGAIVLVVSPGMKCLAHNTPEHNRILDSIMFGVDRYSYPISWNEKIDALHSASYLAVDQYRGEGQSHLDLLNDYGVSGIPDSVSEINFGGNSTHRQYTHMGWDYSYSDDKAKWPIRKRILTNTVGKVFNFAKAWDSNTYHFEYIPKAQSMAAFIYYVHLLGDYQGDFEQPYHYYGSTYMMQLASGSTHDPSVISEIKKCLAIICNNQVNTRVFNGLMTELTTYDSTIYSIIHNSMGILTDEEYEALYDATDGVIKTLQREVPGLLRSEDFFNNSFPENGDDSSSFWDWLPWNKNE